MPKFLIEVPHPDEPLSCAQIVKVFLSSGSHFLTHADWGCMDGVHSAWLVLEADSKEEARNVVPPLFRSHAKIVALNQFSMEQIEGVIRQHQP